MKSQASLSVVIIVAHPDDETLWAGGTLLSNPSWKCFIISLCRGNDTDRASKFRKMLQILDAEGVMADIDDGPDQKPLENDELQQTILHLLPQKYFDLILTHNPNGEYTRHLRHEEVSKAVIQLWYNGKLSAGELRTFAYSDSNKKHFPVADENAQVYIRLSNQIWKRKYNLITNTYGFDAGSWEAQTTPKAEAYWQFTDPLKAKQWLEQFEKEMI